MVQTPDALLESVADQAKHQQQGAALLHQSKLALDTTQSAAVAFAKQASELQQSVAAMQHKEKSGIADELCLIHAA